MKIEENKSSFFISILITEGGHTLTVEEIPAHTHTFTGTQVTTNETGAHTHGRGNMNIYGQLISNSDINNNPLVYPGSLSVGENTFAASSWNNPNVLRYELNDDIGSTLHTIVFDAYKNWYGRTSTEGNHSHTVTAAGTNSNTGGGKTHYHSLNVTDANGTRTGNENTATSISTYQPSLINKI